MKVLLADDAEVVRLMVGRLVESLGHELILACDGLEAVERFAKTQPDMVLMDVLMPRLDGAEAGRRIKAVAGSRWVPVVLITAVEEVNKLADAMELGADDYLIKPVNFRILEAKIKAIERTLELNRKVHEQASKLAEYFDRAEDEKLVARHLMEQLVSRERLSDPQLHSWIAPAESLSGDLVAAARTPGRVLHLMLADGIGHGLTAALNVLPLTEPFYAMTDRGFDLADILVEMHHKVCQVLPAGRFVAVAFVAVDFTRHRIEIWNAGIPDLHLFGANGELLKRWPSQHLPLGILPAPSLSLKTEHYVYNQRCNLVLCSDGLLEARDQTGAVFGMARLVEACAGHLPADALTRTVKALDDFLAGMRCHDDVSLAMIDLDPAMVPLQPAAAALGALPSLTDAKWRYDLSLGAEQLRHLHTVQYLMDFVAQIPPLRHAHANIFLVVQELFLDALDRGLLGLQPDPADDTDSVVRYLLEREQRLSQLQGGHIDIALSGYDVGDHGMLRICITNSGEGITSSGTEHHSRPNGLAIASVRALCASLQFDDSGRMVEAYYQSGRFDVPH
ncbi:PP2C family protein-serine/threonine phosphatase [Chitinimonas sp. PSY-7]|uniref:SpoIIE family protein phosphatase n=1 Tax=Chitinimonas sp. PSY-7 TaxID=3459088 RepID=UPI0040403026